MNYSSQRGFTEFSFFKVFIILIFVIGGWMAAHFSMSYFANIQIQSTMTQAVLKNRSRNLNEDQWKDVVIAAIASENQLKLEPKNLTVLQSENHKKITIEAQYIRPIGIPLTSKSWDLSFSAKVEEDLGPSL